jgi:glycosyltransferase involved in cell wall biosynthesis
MSLSVLMPIYHATGPTELRRCLQSLVDQELKPTQIVLVRDGPVPPVVEQCIEQFSPHLPFENLFFSTNRGLGPALRDGLAKCAHQIVARVDSDDCSLPKRFALQVAFLNGNPEISVVGSWMTERYSSTRKSSIRLRKTPTDAFAIKRYALRRNPMNHPTVMFRKSHVLAAGSYQSCPMFEDYFLWARMLTMGHRLANLPTVLVETQIDPGYFSRRGGITYLRYELELLKKFQGLGFFSTANSLAFIISRVPMRLVTGNLRKNLYRILLRGT